MQQFFALVNALLAAAAATARRRLRIATYTVVPFSPRAGLIEWMSNTVSLGEYLVTGSGNLAGAHRRYLVPKGLLHADIQKGLAQLQLGERSKALGVLDEALQIDRLHEPTLRAASRWWR